MSSRRPLPVAVATVLMAISGLVNLVSPLFPSEGVPQFVIYLGVVLGIGGLVAASGL
jgi:hypothetical protein